MKKNDLKKGYGTISLPMPLINTIKGKIEGTGIYSVSAYVAFILRQVLSVSDDEGMVKEEDVKEIKKKLKSLGYV
jgi:hypothetical protein